MKHLIIRDFGPLVSVDIELKQINLIIGPQSAGKSCVLKIACFCTWLEKRIEIEQSEQRFKEKGVFLDILVTFHKLQGFAKPTTYIAYETDYMRFFYSHAQQIFSFEWKEERWSYKKNKVAYIPAERNLVAAIPNWYEVKLQNNNIRNFMADWETARKNFAEKRMDILDLGVSYYYDSLSKGDKVQVSQDVALDLTNTSSGLQSLVPMLILLQYLTMEIYREEPTDSVIGQAENNALLHCIYQELFEKVGKTLGNTSLPKYGNKVHLLQEQITVAHIGDALLGFANSEYAAECRRIYSNFTKLHHSDIFLEEPEANLFPLTQLSLVNWLAEMVGGERKHNLFIATHSPYIMTSFNNLIQAGDIIKEEPGKKPEVWNIVAERRVIYYENVSAYVLKEGCAYSIMDEDMKLISPAELDSASDEINAQFGKLLDL